MPDELTCNCRELKQRRAQFPSPSAAPLTPDPLSLKTFLQLLLERVSGVLCSLGTSAGDFKFLTTNFTFYLLFIQVLGHLPTAEQSPREQRGRRMLLRTRFVVADVLDRAFLAAVLIIIVMTIIIISRYFFPPPTVSLSRSLPPSVCRLVISFVMLRIFDRKRMLLLICMSDSGFSAGNRPQPGGK